MSLDIEDWTPAGATLVIVSVLVAAGVTGVLFHRLRGRASRSDDTSMTRPLLALSLVGALVILAATSLSIEDKDTRNLLVGGVVSLSSAAVAFYFSSSHATEVRRDMLRLTTGAIVPDLVNMTLQQARAVVSSTSLRLAQPQKEIDPETLITSQDPPAWTSVLAGTTITVMF